MAQVDIAGDGSKGMALLNDKHKFAFFHLYKCGGMSLRKLFADIFEDNYELQGGHSNPIDLKIKFEKEEKLEKFENLFKFTIVRNPFDFMVSTYFYGKTYTNHFMHEEITRRNMTMVEFIPYYMNVLRQHKDSEIRPIGSNKVTTLLGFIQDEKGHILVDFIGKLENINEDMNYILKTIGVEDAQIPINNVNPNREKDYRKYYNSESKAMIEKYFAKDLDYFKYTF